MSVEVKGQDKLLAELEKRFGKQQMQRISDEGLKAGAEVFVKELKSQFKSFKDTGASIDEITVGEPEWQGDTRIIKIYWKGPKDRYRIIHLNEWGTVKNPNPRGKGAIARALKNSEQSYHEAIREAMERGI